MAPFPASLSAWEVAAGRSGAPAPVVHVVPPGVGKLVLPNGGPSIEVRGAPDLTCLELGRGAAVGLLRISGCPRLGVLRLHGSHGTLLEVDRLMDATPLRIEGLIGLVSICIQGQTVQLPKLPEARRLCRDGYIGPAGSVPVGVELVVCTGDGSVAAIEAHRASPVRLALADPHATSLRLGSTGMHSLTLVLLHLCPLLELLEMEPDVAAVSISECHAFRRIIGAGLTVRVSRCHPDAPPRPQLDIGGPWRMVWLTDVQYTLVTGVADAFSVRESPLLEHVASWVDTQVRVEDGRGDAAIDRRTAHPMHLREAIRLAVCLEPGAPPIAERIFARLPRVSCVRVCFLALADMPGQGACLESVWRIREALWVSARQFVDRPPNHHGGVEEWARPTEQSPEDDRVWQADIAVLEACRDDQASANSAVRAAARDEIERLAWVTDPWAIRMLAQARSERSVTGRDHAWIDDVLTRIFRYSPDEDEHGPHERSGDRMFQELWRRRSFGLAPAVDVDGPLLVAHLLADRSRAGGEALLDDCASWLHQTEHRSGGLETLGVLARAGVPRALRALAGIPGGSGCWSQEDRARALPFVLAVLHRGPQDPGRQP